MIYSSYRKNAQNVPNFITISIYFVSGTQSLTPSPRLTTSDAQVGEASEYQHHNSKYSKDRHCGIKDLNGAYLLQAAPTGSILNEKK
jgi:hypothetical protein